MHLMFADDLLLFVKASTDQITVIKEALRRFYLASGQKFSEAKIMFSSRNVIASREAIKACCSFNFTDNLGKYLGVPLLHGRESKRVYYGIIDKVKVGLSGWSASSLSLADRTILIHFEVRIVRCAYIYDAVDKDSTWSGGGSGTLLQELMGAY